MDQSNPSPVAVTGQSEAPTVPEQEYARAAQEFRDAPMPMITEADVMAAARDNFAVFMEMIIGLRNEDFHNELDAVIGNELYRRIVITYPRGHGKSTHLSVGYPLWRIAKDHDLRILLISATEAVSKGFLSEIIGHIERNEAYQAFAKFVDPRGKGVVPRMKNYAKMRDNWSGNSIIIDREKLTLKDPTINAVGLLGSILSKRADLIICDDVVNQENSATEDQRLKVIDWIDTTVRPVLVPSGRFMYLGNTWHPDDFVARALKNPQYDYRKRMRAVISDSANLPLWDQWAKIRTDEDLPIEERLARSQELYLANKAAMDEGVKVLWPERYDYGWLYLERLNNPYAFARMYQCDPSDRPDQKFKESWLEDAVKKGAKMRLQLEKRAGFEMEITTEGVDLAITDKETGDDTARVIVDRVLYSTDPLIKRGDIIVRDIERGKKSPNEVKELIRSDYVNVQPDGIRVETVGYQQAIQRDLDDMGIPVRGYHTGGEKNDPYIGINSLAIYAEQGKLVLPYDQTDPRTVRLVAQLMNEMRAFPDGHTGDTLMALWFAFSEMRDIMAGKIVVPGVSKDPLLKEPVDISVPEVRKAEERKADEAAILEQAAEKQAYQEMMWRARR